jgi:hypothetical protein
VTEVGVNKRVRFYEPRADRSLLPQERRINLRLRSRGLGSIRVRLFRSGKELGYAIDRLPASAGRQVLEEVYRTVTEVLGRRRGRPPGEPTHQMKLRVRESVFRKLLDEARRKKTTPSGLVGDLVERHVV